MALCPAGAAPKPTAPATYWITSADIQSWVGATTYARLAPWVWNLAEQVVSIPQLCASDPPQPTTITDADVLLASSNPVSAVQLVQKLTDFGKWWVWSQQCQCNGTTQACHNFSVPTQYPDDWARSPSIGEVWPGAWWTNQIAANLYHYDINCPPTAWSITESPCHDSDGPHWWQIMPDGTTRAFGAWSAGVSYVGLADMSALAATYGPQFGLGIQCYVGGPTGSAPISFLTSGGPPVVGPPTPAPPPTNINITIAPYPPPPCSTVSDICAIIWNIKNYQNVVQNNTFVNSQPTQYQGGIETIISGKGELDVAQGTLGLSVTVLANPPGLDPQPDDPAEYWNLGWIRTGNTVGWDRKAWIRTSGQRIFPPSLPFTKYAWTLADGVTLNVEQLVPLEPPP